VTLTQIDIFDDKARVGEVQANHVADGVGTVERPHLFGNFGQGDQLWHKVGGFGQAITANPSDPL
jgi:hypothetical protein